MEQSKKPLPGVTPKLQYTADDILTQLGPFKKFHIFNYFIVFVAVVVTAIYSTSYVFLAGNTNYRCRIEECESENTTVFQPSWLSSAIPSSGSDAKCARYKTINGECSSDSFGDEIYKCKEWVYESHASIVAEFNLACNDWKRTLVGTVRSIGMLVALPIIGHISDTYGRKFVLAMTTTMTAVFGTLKGISVSYEMYITVEFFESLVATNVFMICYIIIVELVGQDKRVLISSFLGVALVIGEITLALSFRAIEYWRTWLFYLYPISLIFISYFFIVPESIRWLLCKGRKKEALEVIKKAEKWNNVEIPLEIIYDLEKIEENDKCEKAVLKEKSSLFKEVIRSKIIIHRMAVGSFLFVSCAFIYYGITINSVSLAGDKYVNFILVASAQIPGTIASIYLLNRAGRKKCLIGAFLVCGVVCISITFIPKAHQWLTIVLYLTGKATITFAFGGIYMYISELFPTQGRHSLLGFCSSVGRIGSIVAPQTPLLMIYMESLPSLLFGGFALLSALLVMTTPETLNVKLPDTIQEAEQLSMCDTTCREKITLDVGESRF